MSVQQKPGFRPEKLADFLEVAYDLVPDDPTWLRRTMEAAIGVFGRGHSAHGAIYDASDVAAFRIQHAEFIGFSPPELDCMMRGLGLFTPAMVARSFRCLLVGRSRETGVGMPEMGPMLDELVPYGRVDAFNINGLDPSGLATFFALWTDQPIELAPPELQLYRRMAHHVGAAHRVRRRLRERQADRPVPDPTEGAEAILDADKRVVHAEGPAREQAARQELIAAADVRDRARTAKAKDHERLANWFPLTQARWTLVDTFERDGTRYIVARENQSSASGLKCLTDRERQAVAYVAVGQSSKEAAYALGISDATVRVLLARALAKLGVRSRAELLLHEEVRRLSPGSKTPLT